MLGNSIDSPRSNSKEISGQLQQIILNSVRKLTPDQMIERTCEEVGYRFRRRKVTPIVTVLPAATEGGVEDPLRISFVHAVRAVISFSAALSRVHLGLVQHVYHAMLIEIASHLNPKRPGRLEPRAVCRERKHYPSLKTTRAQWRINHAA
jgi:hypothetical protein